MSVREQIPAKAAVAAPAHVVNEALPLHLTALPFGTLQRKCACGGSSGSGDECEGCKQKRTLQRQVLACTPAPNALGDTNAAASSISTRSFGSRLGHNFSRVRVHVARPLQAPAPLQISQPGDQAEREADCVAGHIMRMPEPSSTGNAGRPFSATSQPLSRCSEAALYRQPNDDQEEKKDGGDSGPIDNDMPKPPEESTQCPGPMEVKQREEDKVHRQPLGAGMAAGQATGQNPSVASGVAELMNEAGSPLSARTGAFFEPRFGYSFDHVRVHSDARAAASARAVHARAYTLGNHIVFGEGQYAPDTSSGRHLLAHELTHVLQQRPSQLLAMANDHANPPLRISPVNSGPPALQRWSIGDPDTTINTIICDGSDKVTTQLNATGNADQTRCLRDCIEAHEQSHRSDAITENATICRGVAAGKTVRPNAGAQRNATEIKASNVEIDCIRPQLARVGEVCKGIMEARIKQMEEYRDSFK